MDYIFEICATKLIENINKRSCGNFIAGFYYWIFSCRYSFEIPLSQVKTRISNADRHLFWRNNATQSAWTRFLWIVLISHSKLTLGNVSEIKIVKYSHKRLPSAEKLYLISLS